MKDCVVPENNHPLPPTEHPLTWKEYFTMSKMLWCYTIMQKLIFVSAIKREKILLFMVVHCLIISILHYKGLS